ncbi:MAG: hypothetical protein JRN19_04245 [Nitrososphaerota archaeon]|nr:hypothetical protein [Nitrososphaerota archaeon]
MASSIAKEMATLLDSDESLINAYIVLLLAGFNENRGEVVEGGKGVKTGLEGGLLERAVENGLAISTSSGYVPLHPRMAMSNLYRLSCIRNPDVRKNRPRVDALVAKLIRLWDG